MCVCVCVCVSLPLSLRLIEVPRGRIVVVSSYVLKQPPSRRSISMFSHSITLRLIPARRRVGGGGAGVADPRAELPGKAT